MIGDQQTMARSGNLADWQGRQAAQHQDDERLARERTRQEKEQQQEAADEQTAEVLAQVKRLDEVLTSVLALPPMSFDRLMAVPRIAPFDPGSLGTAAPGPDWSDFAPPEPDGLHRFLYRFLGRLLPGAARYRRQLAQAQSRFEAAQAEYRQQESQRRQALAVAKAKYHQKVTEERGRAAARNAYVARRQAAFTAGDAESGAWYVRAVLKASRYPDDFPREYQVAYDPVHRSVAVESELPPRRVVPSARAYRYVPARDAIEPVPRPEHEIGQRYQQLIAGLALRTLHEIFAATAPAVVQAVSFTGYVTSIDPATGKPGRRPLLSVSAERRVFEDLVLAAVEPAACLAGLGGSAPAEASE